MKTMHLFAGVGGGLLGDLILGHEPIIAVEWDKYACAVLRERVTDGWFPNLHVWEGDVRLFDPSQYAGRVDCIHAGFPCQDISTAGNQAGIGEGTRSGLYREVLRIADVLRPRYLFLENVAAIVTGNNGDWLRTIIADLAERGYLCKWRCLSAAEIGANHKRNRWWLLAHSYSVRPVHGEPEVQPTEGREYALCDIGASGEDVAYASYQGLQRSEATGNDGEVRQESRNEQPAGCSSGNEWNEIECRLGRVANNVPNRVHRLKGLGNAQVPLQAAVAFKLLMNEIR